MGVEKTSIITFTNDGKQDVKTFRIWLSQDANFESFKTEKGWIGEKNSQGVIVFSSSESIKENESVKFGIKTDKPNPVINWKGLDNTNSVIDTGVISTEKIQKVNENPNIESNKNIIDSDGGIFSDSVFRIIPDKPNAGSTIRVTGNSFEAEQNFDFYIDENKIGSFETNENGFFITTMKIPEKIEKERVDFKIKNNQGQEKIYSVRLGELQNQMASNENFKITINGINNTVYQGETLKINGSGNPNSSITIEITDPNGISIITRTSSVDIAGKWELKDPIFIPFDLELGKYSIKIADGENQILKNWSVESDKKISIESTKKMFEAGDLITFSGTAIPNIPIELNLENELGNHIDSVVIQIDDSGIINYEYQTIENFDKEGTWILIATQGKEKEFAFVGYGEFPSIPINIEFDKSNYKESESALISLIGQPKDKVKIMIINPTGGIVGNDIPITLASNGKANYNLDLSGYSSGIYTAVIKKANSQNSEQFSVGLQTGSGPIEVQTTQLEYERGERVLLLGNAKPNSLLITTLMDPSGKEIRSLETPTDNVGKFSEDKIRVPTNAIEGEWKIVISSGPNLTTLYLPIAEISEKVLEIKLSDLVSAGEIVPIEITTSFKTTVMIEIVNSSGTIIKEMTCNTTKDFICQTFWQISKDLPAGTYSIKAQDGTNYDEKEFAIRN
jgi:hypothetical protein